MRYGDAAGNLTPTSVHHPFVMCVCAWSRCFSSHLRGPPHKLNPLSQSALLCCCLLSSFWRTGLRVLFLNSHSLDTCLSRQSPCEWQASDLNTCSVIRDLGWPPSADGCTARNLAGCVFSSCIKCVQMCFLALESPKLVCAPPLGGALRHPRLKVDVALPLRNSEASTIVASLNLLRSCPP